MPIFEFVCDACGHAFEHLARTRSDTPRACPACGSARLSKQLSSFAPRAAVPKGCGSCASEARCPASRAGGCGCSGACSH